MISLAIGSDNLIELDKLVNEATDAYVNDATVRFTLRDSALTAVTGAENQTMTYVAASNGKYQGTLQDTVSLTAGSLYYLDITATKASIVLFRRLPCRAEYRGET